MKKLVVMIIVSAACAVGAAGTAGQAKAGGGTSAYNPCPVTAPYLHTNVFGKSYCSIYP